MLRFSIWRSTEPMGRVLLFCLNVCPADGLGLRSLRSKERCDQPLRCIVRGGLA